MPIIILSIFVFALLGSPGAAWAYVDPGSITVTLQVLLASAVGVVFALRQKISYWLGRLFGKKQSKESIEKSN